MVTLLSENHHIATIVKMIRALPHFPPQRIPEIPEDFHILGGFLAITRLANPMGVLNRIVQLVDYVRQYWLTTVRPSGFTVYSVNIRTNNYVESFHSMLESNIGLHPPVWSYYDRLRSIESRVWRETLQTFNGQLVQRSIVSSRDTNNCILADAQQSVCYVCYDTMAYLGRH